MRGSAVLSILSQDRHLHCSNCSSYDRHPHREGTEKSDTSLYINQTIQHATAGICRYLQVFANIGMRNLLHTLQPLPKVPAKTVTAKPYLFCETVAW